METAKFPTARPTTSIAVSPATADTTSTSKASARPWSKDASGISGDSALIAFPISNSRAVFANWRDVSTSMASDARNAITSTTLLTGPAR